MKKNPVTTYELEGPITTLRISDVVDEGSQSAERESLAAKNVAGLVCGWVSWGLFVVCIVLFVQAMPSGGNMFGKMMNHQGGGELNGVSLTVISVLLAVSAVAGVLGFLYTLIRGKRVSVPLAVSSALSLIFLIYVTVVV